jgi:predicted ATP-grasp superfamily ATP-dependent carboligase
MADPFRLLIHEHVTGGGLFDDPSSTSWLAEGRAMRQALIAEFSALPDVAIAATRDARLHLDDPPGLRSIIVEPGQLLEHLFPAVRQAQALILVAPETGDTLLNLHAALAGGPATLLGSSTAAIALTGDKLALAQRLVFAGIPHPRTEAVFPGTSLSTDRDFPSPAVLKPLDGAGCLETFLVDGSSPLGSAPRLPALLQEFVPGIPMSASFLVDARGSAHLVGIGRQLVALAAGQFRYQGGVLPAGSPELARPLLPALEAVPGLLGWVGVDFVLDARASQPVLIEINPRLTTSFVALHHLLPPGTLAQAWLDAVLDPDRLDGIDLASRIHQSPPIGFQPDGALLEPAEMPA